jgi:hypothetical protein
MLGSTSRKLILDSLRQSSGQPYTEQELNLYRPVVFETLVRCAKALETEMKNQNIAPPSDSIWECTEYISDDRVDPRGFAMAMDAILESPAVSELLARANEFDLPDNAG